MTGEARAAVPWSFSEARTSFAAWLAGTALLMVCWWESSGTGRAAKQTVWANLGVAAVALIVLASIMWVSSGRRAVRARRNHLNDRLEQVGSAALLRPAVESAAPDPDGLVMIAGTSRYHRPGCLLVASKPASTATDQIIDSARLEPCEMCRP